MNNYLPILAIESSGSLCSTAVYFNEKEYSENNIVGKHVHSEKLQLSVDYSLRSSGKSINDINLIAISIGPGSFTGLRIGMSVAKGLAFGKNIPLVAVPTFDAFALQMVDAVEEDQSFLIANNVNQDELYVGEYKNIEGRSSTVKEVYLAKKSDFDNNEYEDIKIFGDYLNQSEVNINSTPNALFVAKWAYFFGKDLVTSNYDYLEPNYIKNFIAKVKK